MKYNPCIFIRHFCFVILLLAVNFYALQAQKTPNTRLTQQQVDKQNKEKVDQWNKLAEAYLNKGGKAAYKTGLSYAKNAENLARQIPYAEGLYFAYLNQAKIYEKRDSWGDSKEAKKVRELADLTLAKVMEKDREAIKRKEEELNKLDKELKTKEGEIHELSYENEEKDEIIQEKDTIISLKELENRQKDALLKATQAEKDLKDLQIATQQEESRFYIIFAVLAAIIALALLYLYFDKRKTNGRLEEQNQIIAKEKQRSEELLLNILPAELAEELKEKGSAKVQTYDEASVMFTDFKDFTIASEHLSPTELVAEIHHCFSAFDRIVEKYNIEKIKTIGDAYLCVGGVPTPDANHAENVVKAALEMRDFMIDREEKQKKEGKMFFEIRIGIHTGPLVAGIVGVKKFAYDIWGDTVNTASRLESSGEPGKVNVSGQTYKLIKNKFLCEYRGRVPAKNKGQIDMYFVEDLNNH